MIPNNIFQPKIEKLREQKELKDLRRLLSLKGNNSEGVISATWTFLKKMQKELELPSLSPIKQHYYFYQKLEEIRKALNLPFTNFPQLNQLYIEINSVRELLGFPEMIPISEIITLIQRESFEKFASLNIGYDSLLLKILLLHSTSNKQNSKLSQERSTSIQALDRDLYEILKSYGPLSRPELVQLIGVARSSIYDSLQRLILRGYVVQYSEKRSHTGRPTTIFDALI